MIDGGTGEITVNAALDYETTDEYRLTVEASDERGGTDTATVTVTVTDVAEDPPPVPTGLTVSLADGVFLPDVGRRDRSGQVRGPVAHRCRRCGVDGADGDDDGGDHLHPGGRPGLRDGVPVPGAGLRRRGDLWRGVGPGVGCRADGDPGLQPAPRVRPELLRLLHPRERRDEHRSGHRLGHGPGPERHGELRHHGGERRREVRHRRERHDHRGGRTESL